MKQADAHESSQSKPATKPRHYQCSTWEHRQTSNALEAKSRKSSSQERKTPTIHRHAHSAPPAPYWNAAGRGGDINERDIPKSGLFGMLGGETPRERYNRRIGLRPSNEKKRSVFHPGCKPCIDCGRALRPSGVKAKEMPGTLNYAAHGRCSQCLNAAVKKGLVHPKQRRETYEGKHCAGCGRALRPWSKTVEEMPGTVKHHARGMCGSCYRTELRGLEVAA